MERIHAASLTLDLQRVPHVWTPVATALSKPLVPLAVAARSAPRATAAFREDWDMPSMASKGARRPQRHRPQTEK